MLERVREEHAVENLELGVVPDGEHCAREVAEAVERKHRGVFERRDVEGGRDVGTMMLDVVELRAQRAAIDAERIRDGVADVSDLQLVRQPFADVRDAGAMAQRAADLRADIGTWITADGDVVELIRRDACLREAPRGRE